MQRAKSSKHYRPVIFAPKYRSRQSQLVVDEQELANFNEALTAVLDGKVLTTDYRLKGGTVVTLHGSVPVASMMPAGLSTTT